MESFELRLKFLSDSHGLIVTVAYYFSVFFGITVPPSIKINPNEIKYSQSNDLLVRHMSFRIQNLAILIPEVKIQKLKFQLYKLFYISDKVSFGSTRGE